MTLEALFEYIFAWASSIWRDREDNNEPIQENNYDDENQ